MSVQHEAGWSASRKSVLIGILRIARGRADGIACFGSSPQAFLSSLAPLLAFPLVGAVLADVQRRAAPGADGLGHDVVRTADAGGGVV